MIEGQTMSQGESQYSRAPRHPFEGPVQIPEGEGQGRNISNSGLYFEADGSFDAGAIVKVSIVLNNLATMPPVELAAEGRVVRVERLDGKVGVAIEFASVRLETAETRAARLPD
jgi:hypothetical protein